MVLFTVVLSEVHTTTFLCCNYNCSDAKYKIIHQHHKPQGQDAVQKAAGCFQAFAKIATLLVLLHKARCKKPSLSYYYCVVNAALPQFLTWFYYQFSIISTSIIHPVKQSKNIVYLEAIDLLVTRKLENRYLHFVKEQQFLTDLTAALYTSSDANFTRRCVTRDLA